ncbi:MAG: hypothetical protein NUW07_07135 [Candidatus Saccharicenans sp.]|jgi:hypothetical protein|nr:hypothetical protein [Candidatus Saccharicenans sp.]MDH7494129.1 hypothetical protein [Candidatus Saccharicenans sp.]
MDLIIFEDTVRYDRWVKIILAVPLLVFLILGTLMLLDSRGQDIFPNEPPGQSSLGSIAMFGAAGFVIVIFLLVFPRSIAVAQDGIVLKFRAFSWKIPFKSIGTVEISASPFGWRTQNFAFSFRKAVDIIKKSGARVRISPAHPYQFLESATRALEDWKRYHPEGLSY